MKFKWEGLSGPKLAEAMLRGTIRTARKQVKSRCVICAKPVFSGDRYYDVDGIRYAHTSCVESELPSSKTSDTGRRVITHAMKAEIAKAKSAPGKTSTALATKPASKTITRKSKATVQKAKANKAAKTTTISKPTEPIIRPDENRSLNAQIDTALPGVKITLTIEGSAEMIQRALDRLQN